MSTLTFIEIVLNANQPCNQHPHVFGVAAFAELLVYARTLMTLSRLKMMSKTLKLKLRLGLCWKNSGVCEGVTYGHVALRYAVRHHGHHRPKKGISLMATTIVPDLACSEAVQWLFLFVGLILV